ncbi:MAG: acyl-CoA-binding protein [Thiomonas delicata]
MACARRNRTIVLFNLSRRSRMDMHPQTDFESAVARAKNLPRRPDNATLLRLYALYKQASEGDAAGARPGIADFVARAKWDAWATLAGTPSAQAMRDYIALVDALQHAA